MRIEGKIDDLLKDWAMSAMTDPWPERILKTDPEDLTYSAFARCACGSGMAYETTGVGREWGCSAILTGEAEPSTEHSELYPFYMWKIKSENAEQSTRNPYRSQS